MCAMQNKKAYIHNEIYTMEIDIMKSTHNERIHNKKTHTIKMENILPHNYRLIMS